MTDERTAETDREEEHEHPWAEKLEQWRERYQERGRIYRVLYTTTGAILVLAGIAMLVLPGPAFVVIPIGLAMLAMEFAWAENALEKALVQADKASQKARDASRAQKIMGGVATALGIAAAVAAWFLWEIPVIPG